MNEADLNLLPLATAGDWMRDPRRYRERASWLRAVRELAGPGRRGRARREPLRAFAEASYSTKLDFDDAPTFARTSRAFLERYTRGPGWVGRHARSSRASSRWPRTPPARCADMPNSAFADQAEPFLAATRQAAGAGAAGHRSADGRAPGADRPPHPPRLHRTRDSAGSGTRRRACAASTATA